MHVCVIVYIVIWSNSRFNIIFILPVKTITCKQLRRIIELYQNALNSDETLASSSCDLDGIFGVRVVLSSSF